MSNTTKILSERRSAKRYESTYNLTDEEINDLIESIRFTPSSFGIEPYRVLFIQDPKLRSELKPAMWNQAGVDSSSGIVLWVSYKDDYLENKHIPEMLKNNIPEEFKKVRDDMFGGVRAVLADRKITLSEWAIRQAYISLSSAIISSSEMGLSNCAIEGWSVDAVSKVLEDNKIIDSKIEQPCLAMFVGKVDLNQEFHYNFKKIRRETKDMSNKIK